MCWRKYSFLLECFADVEVWPWICPLFILWCEILMLIFFNSQNYYLTKMGCCGDLAGLLIFISYWWIWNSSRTWRLAASWWERMCQWILICEYIFDGWHYAVHPDCLHNGPDSINCWIVDILLLQDIPYFASVFWFGHAYNCLLLNLYFL
jgi:hypothetical protein